MKKDIPEKFWNKWFEAEEDERIRLVQRIMIAKELAEHMALNLNKAKLSKKLIKEMAARNINNYFQDFEQYMASKKFKAENQEITQRAESLAKKSKLTKKDVEAFSKKIKSVAAKKLSDSDNQ